MKNNHYSHSSNCDEYTYILASESTNNISLPQKILLFIKFTNFFFLKKIIKKKKSMMIRKEIKVAMMTIKKETKIKCLQTKMFVGRMMFILNFLSQNCIKSLLKKKIKAIN